MAKISLMGIVYTESKPAPSSAVAGGFDLEVKDKDLLVLAGPEGSGKTALLRLIAGLESECKGSVCIDEKKVMTQGAFKEREIALVFRDGALYPHMSVYENLAFGMKVRKVPKPELARRIQEAVSILGIEHLLPAKAASLSGGDASNGSTPSDSFRVALARAMVRQPKVYLLDAPLSGLDPDAKGQLQAEIVRLHERLQATMLYATSDPMEALSVGTRIVVINDGVIQQDGVPADIYLSPANLFVAGFFGAPPMNLIHGKLKDAGDHLQFREQGEGTIQCSIPESLATRAYAGKDVILGIRPEQITPIVDSNKAQESFRNQGAGALFKGLVDHIEPKGAETLVHFQTGAHSLISWCDAFLERSHAGHRMQFELDLSKACLFDPLSTLRIA